MDYNEKFRFIQSLLGSGTYNSSSKECMFFCPFCPTRHHKPKLAINVESDFWQCWICGTKGKGLYGVIRKVGSRDDIEQYNQRFKAKSIKSPRKDDKTDDFIVNLPKEYVPVIEYKDHLLGKKAYDYLIKVRKITENDILRHKIGTCFEGQYANKIVFPSFNAQGLINFFTARAYDGSYWIPKVPKGYKSTIILNELNVDFTKPVTILEGFGDLYKANDNAVPLLGSYLLEDSVLFETIVANCDTIYLGLDPDADDKADVIAQSFLKYDFKVYQIPVLPYKDVGEMSKEEFLSRYKESTLIDRNSILRRRMRNL